MATSTDNGEPHGPLADLTVVDLSTTLPGAQATQFLADAGANVIVVEPPAGTPVRRHPGWPALLRGKRSVQLDLKRDADRDTLSSMLDGADVLVTTMRPKAAARMGLTAARLAEEHPRLVAAQITGWGSSGPWADRKGYEGLVLAKTGVLHSKRQLGPGDDPAFVSTPYASFAAAQNAVQGIIAALIEREVSGLGQMVEANLVSGVGALDTYNWFYEMILRRYPGAFQPLIAPFDDEGRPQSRLMYALLVAATKDGAWLQFAQNSPRLMQTWLAELGLESVLDDPKWADFPDLPTAELRDELWRAMLERVNQRSLADWEETFAANPNLFAEQLRTPQQALEHPQLLHDGRVIEVETPRLGGVRQPSSLVHASGAPLTRIGPPPSPGEHDADIRDLVAGSAGRAVPLATDEAPAYPLQGVTVLELGSMFAGPFGATVAAELGARVIKVEPFGGDMIRTMMAFPEAGAGKVLQGKESIALDMQNPTGLDIIHRLVQKADVVLQCYRAGVADRAGIDEASLKKINPDIVYVNAPGYGTAGPYGAKPAYAPSIAAASGVTLSDAPWGGVFPETTDDVRRGAKTLWAGAAVPAVNTDGIAALGVASAILLGLYAHRRGRPLAGIETSMLASATHVLIGENAGYQKRPAGAMVDSEFRGLGPLYRLYRAADGWIFLAAPDPEEWPVLVEALGAGSGLADVRFATEEGRTEHADALADVLETLFSGDGKEAWEDRLTACDIGCVAVAQENAEWRMQTDEFYEAGYAVDAVSPIFDEYRRPAPLSRFSRSSSRAEGGCTVGQHTDAILAELGFDVDEIHDLRAQRVVE